VAATGLAGCQVASPITTDLDYEPADGVSVGVGDVVVRDLLVISEAAEGEGVLRGLVVNEGSEPATVSIQLEDQSSLAPQLEVPPGGSARLDGVSPTGETGEPVTITSVPSAPGTYMTLRVVTADGDAGSARVPILPPEGPYSDLARSTAGDEAGSTEGDGAGSTEGDDAETTTDG
jgi:hypothetical protein